MRVHRRAQNRAGFTLIEMIAVVMILGLAMALVLPNMSGRRTSRLKDQGKQIAGRLEVARQRAIVSGLPHRLFLDLEEGFMRIDWWTDEHTALVKLGVEEDEPELVPAEPDLNGPISLRPTADELTDFFPIPGRYGREAFLREDYYFVGVESESGWFETGGVEIVFAGDGTAEYSEINLSDAWDNVLVLEIQPVLDVIRMRVSEDG